MSRRGGDSSRVYVGGLPDDVRSRDIESLFERYGKITYVDLKSSKRGSPYAFVEFEDHRDASDAVRDRDGYKFDGSIIKVEFPRRDGPGGGEGGGGSRGYRGDSYGGYSRGGRFGGGGRGGSGPPSRRSEYRLLVKGLPASGSWQDLKDHMRQAGEVCYADVYKDGTGVVEFARYEDMKFAVKKLDDSKFRSHENESSYIRVKGDYQGGSSRGRSRSRSRSLSPKRSRASPRYSPYH